jgi:hypothetical protein
MNYNSVMFIPEFLIYNMMIPQHSVTTRQLVCMSHHNASDEWMRLILQAIWCVHREISPAGRVSYQLGQLKCVPREGNSPNSMGITAFPSAAEWRLLWVCEYLKNLKVIQQCGVSLNPLCGKFSLHTNWSTYWLKWTFLVTWQYSS